MTLNQRGGHNVIHMEVGGVREAGVLQYVVDSERLLVVSHVMKGVRIRLQIRESLSRTIKSLPQNNCAGGVVIRLEASPQRRTGTR